MTKRLALTALLLGSTLAVARAGDVHYAVEHKVDEPTRAAWNGALLRCLLKEEPQGQDELLLKVLRNPEMFKNEPWGKSLGPARDIRPLPPGPERDALIKGRDEALGSELSIQNVKTTALINEFWPKAMAGRPALLPPEPPAEALVALEGDRLDAGAAELQARGGGRRERGERAADGPEAAAGGQSGGAGSSSSGGASGSGKTNPAYDRQLAGVSPGRTLEEAKRGFETRKDDLDAKLPGFRESSSAPRLAPSAPAGQGFRAPGSAASAGPLPVNATRPVLARRAFAPASPFADAALRDSPAALGGGLSPILPQGAAGETPMPAKNEGAAPKSDELTDEEKHELEGIQKLIEDACATGVFDEAALERAFADGAKTEIGNALASDMQALFSEFGEEGLPYSAAGAAAEVEQRFGVSLSPEAALRLVKAIRAHGPPPRAPLSEREGWWRRLLRWLASCWRRVRSFGVRLVSPY